MTQLFGFSGAHRVGKSTICEKIADRYENVGFVRTTTSEVFRKLDIDPSEVLGPEKRLFVQRRILETLCYQWSTYSHEYAVTDRTPVCLVAYTISDFRASYVGEHSRIPQHLLRELLSYIKDCMDAASNLFETIIIVRPGIPIVKEQGKALCTKEKINEIDELVMTVRKHYKDMMPIHSLPEAIVDLETRLSLATAIMGEEELVT